MWITQQLHCLLLTSRGPKVTLHTRGQLVPPQPGIGAHTCQIFPAWPPVPLSRDPRSPQGRTFRSPCLPTAHSQLSLPGPPKPARSLPDTPPATQSGPPCPAIEAVPVTANCPRGCTLCLRQPRRPPSPPFRLGLGSSLRPASRPTRPHPPDTHTTPPPLAASSLFFPQMLLCSQPSGPPSSARATPYPSTLTGELGGQCLIPCRKPPP